MDDGRSNTRLSPPRSTTPVQSKPMHLVEIIREPDTDRRERLIGFVEQVSGPSGVRPLSDHLWLDLEHGARTGFIAVTISDPSGILGMAQISAANEGATLEVVIGPDADAEHLPLDLVDTAIDAYAADGGGALTWWVDDATDGQIALAAERQLHPTRALHEMRRPLPADRHATVETRSFVSGADDDAWLRVNNAAFADHAEQGGWTAATLDARKAESWFDPDGFRIHEIDGRVAAFCWTKLHHDETPVIGEIYVIAVDPEFHGRGLGTQLTLAGLDSISDRGVGLANLYVDADNDAAVHVYERLGFTIHRTRRALAGTVSPLS